MPAKKYKVYTYEGKNQMMQKIQQNRRKNMKNNKTQIQIQMNSSALATNNIIKKSYMHSRVARISNAFNRFVGLPHNC